MDPRKNLFRGLECELHAVREQKSHEIFADVYRQTVKRVGRVARGIAPRHCYFSMSECVDYVQEGYSGLWSHLESYRWICPRCGDRFTTVWGFDIHGCEVPEPKHTIAEYASFVTRRAMQHYQRRHIAGNRDERKAFGVALPIANLAFLNLDLDDLIERKDAIELVRDLACVESDHLIRFVVESTLDGQTMSEIYDDGLDRGVWRDRQAAYGWLVRAKTRGAFAAYAKALAG